LVAAPSYIEAKPPLQHPKDLRSHSCLTLIFASVETVWELRTKEGRSARINVTDSLSSNSLSALKELVLLGEGIALLPNSVCMTELDKKGLYECFHFGRQQKSWFN
jgi:DNA-binding transcriptional LysR family regulator